MAPAWSLPRAASARIDRFEVSDLACKIAGSDSARRRKQRHLQSRSVDGAEGAAQGRQLHQSCHVRCNTRRSTTPDGSRRSHEEQITTGVMIGSGIGGIEGIAETAVLFKERGPRRVSPFFIPGRIINLASGYVSIDPWIEGAEHSRWSLHAPPAAHAIGDAGRMIALGDADVMVAGGSRIVSQSNFDCRLCRGAGALHRL